MLFHLLAGLKKKSYYQGYTDGVGVVDNNKCLLCTNGTETLSHILADCPYAKEVWMEVLCRNQCYRNIGTWERELERAVEYANNNKLINKVRTLSFTTTIYCIWMERNGRIHNRGVRSPGQLLNEINNMMKIKISTWKNTNRSYTNWMVCNQWGLPESMMYL